MHKLCFHEAVNSFQKGSVALGLNCYSLQKRTQETVNSGLPLEGNQHKEPRWEQFHFNVEWLELFEFYTMCVIIIQKITT